MNQTIIELCPHFGVCGGCSSQNVSYERQLAQKESAVKNALRNISVGTFLPIMPSPEQYFYRNKMEYSFGNENDVHLLNRLSIIDHPSSVHLGLHPKGRFALVTPTPECLLQSPESQKILKVVSSWATEEKIPVYVRKDNAGVLRHLVIREGKNTGERMVNLCTTSALAETSVESLAEELKRYAVTTFLWTINDALADVASGDVERVFWGSGFIYERVQNIRVKVNPTSFMQTNTKAAEQMIRILREWIEKDVVRNDTLVDLYCGAGVIGLNLADNFKHLIGVELNERALEDARANAVYNGILRTEFLAGRAEDLTQVITQATVVVDPPRVGLHKNVVKALLDVKPRSLLYVSCNPESLARDLLALRSKYTIERVQPMDFFPHTDHVETMVALKS